MEASSQIQNLLVSVVGASVEQLFYYLTLEQIGPKSEPQPETEETI